MTLCIENFEYSAQKYRINQHIWQNCGIQINTEKSAVFLDMRNKKKNLKKKQNNPIYNIIKSKILGNEFDQGSETLICESIRYWWKKLKTIQMKIYLCSLIKELIMLKFSCH